MRSVASWLAYLVGFFAGPAMADDSALDWISMAQGRAGEWQDMGRLELPSGRIFIGDTSWGDDYHMRGAHAVPVLALNVWVHVMPDDNQVSAVWLSTPAGTTAPVQIMHRLNFGMDSAYFATGDAMTGTAIAELRNREVMIPEAPDGFELFLPYIQAPDFVATWVKVPPDAGDALAVNTRADGSLQAVWTKDAAGNFSGILIDIMGRADDGTFIDTLLNSDE